MEPLSLYVCKIVSKSAQVRGGYCDMVCDSTFFQAHSLHTIYGHIKFVYVQETPRWPL